MPKRLERTSKYAKYDLDGDGEVTDEELERHQQLVELELREEKADSQRNMAWVAMISMVMFFAGLVSSASEIAASDTSGAARYAEAEPQRSRQAVG